MSVTRVLWRERQRLRAADLLAEQAYHLQALGRHHLAPHDWGVVRGLRLAPVKPRYSLDWTLMAGVAIDGYGRELLVREPIEFSLPEQALDGGAYRVFLYYCETPSSCPPCAPCREAPAPRILQHVQLVVSDTLSPITGDAADLALARAAGRVPDASPWPVFVGEITVPGPRTTSYDDVRYLRQRASLLRSPSGYVILRQGLLGPEDRFHLLLSTDASSASPVRRLAIDRDGTVHVWKPLWITGGTAHAEAAIAPKALLLINAPMPAGAGRRIFLSGVVADPAAPRLTLRWQDSAGFRSVVEAPLEGARPLSRKQFVFAGSHAVEVSLVEAARPDHAIAITHKVRGTKERELIARAFEVEVKPRDGWLRLFTRSLPVGAPVLGPCDDDGRAAQVVDAPVPGGGVVYFRAAEQPVPGPTRRAIQAVPGVAGSAPATMLRISGGERDDGDHGARVTLGIRSPVGIDPVTWTTGLSVDGGGRVSLPEIDTTLTVDQTFQLPAITPNPADPLTQDLLALAYNAGLRRVGRIDTTANMVTFTQHDVKRGESLKYTVDLTLGGMKLKRVLELVVGEEPRHVTLRSIPELAGTTGTVHQDVVVPAFQHAASTVHVALELLLSKNDKDYAYAAVSGPIAVTD